jgi:2-phosphoglycerate kinase
LKHRERLKERGRKSKKRNEESPFVSHFLSSEKIREVKKITER